MDFVVYGPERFYGIEIKHAERVHRVDLRGLKLFRDDYPRAQTALLHRGSESLLIDGVSCIPCEDFLRRLRPGQDLPLPNRRSLETSHDKENPFAQTFYKRNDRSSKGEIRLP